MLSRLKGSYWNNWMLSDLQLVKAFESLIKWKEIKPYLRLPWERTLLWQQGWVTKSPDDSSLAEEEKKYSWMLNDKTQRLRTTQFPAEFLHDTNVNSFFPLPWLVISRKRHNSKILKKIVTYKDLPSKTFCKLFQLKQIV